MGKIALKYISPILLAFVRIFVVSIIFIFIYYTIGIPKRIKPYFYKIFLLSLLGIIAAQYFFIIGLQYTKPEHSALSISFIPIFTHIIAYIFKVEKFSIKTILCLLSASTGFFIIHFNNSIFSTIFIGDLITLASALSFSIYMVLLKLYQINLSSFAISSLSYIFAMPVAFLITTPYFNEIPSILNYKVILPLSYIVVFPSIIAYILHIWLIKKIGATKVSLYTFLQPIWATIFSFIFYENSLTLNFILGGIIILLSIILSEI